MTLRKYLGAAALALAFMIGATGCGGGDVIESEGIVIDLNELRAEMQDELNEAAETGDWTLGE